MKKTILALFVVGLLTLASQSCTTSYDEAVSEISTPEFTAPSQDGNAGGDPDGGD